MLFVQKLEKKFPWIDKAIILLLILFLGAFLRLQYINKTSFPMNDGGFFYVMIRDLQQNGYRLPQFTTYNFLNIPYAYPPLSLYESAWLNQYLHIDLLKVFLYYPLVFNLFSILAFYFLSRELVEDSRSALLATVFYAILASGYEWLISGGGLTRSPAHMLYLISLTFFLIYLRSSKKWAFIISVVAGALMTLHHIEYSWLLAYGVVLFTFSKQRNFKSLIPIALFGFGVALLTSPYWLTVLRFHGLPTFLSAFSTGEITFLKAIRRLLELDFTSEPIVSILNIMAFIGLFVSIAKKRYTLPLWFFLMIFLSYRSAYRTLLVPVSILAAMALDDLIIPGLNQIAMKTQQISPRRKSQGFPVIGQIFAALCIFIPFLMGFVTSLSEHPILASVNPAELEAMQWVKSNTDPGSSFVIINPSIDWYVDRVGEWFPAMTGRHSATTLQGMEWLPNKEFVKQRWYYSNFKRCIMKGEACLLLWAEQTDTQFTHLFISKSECTWNSENCTDFFIQSMEDTAVFKKVFENSGVVIFDRKQ